MLIMKFGGTSVGSPKRIKEVAELIKDGRHPRIVVLSAMAGVTNTLVEISRLYRIRNFQGALALLAELRQKYMDAIDELYASEKSKKEARKVVGAEMKTIEGLCNDFFTDFEEKIVLSRGELISTQMMEIFLHENGVSVVRLPALEYMVTDKFGEPNLKAIEQGLKRLLEQYPKTQKLFLTEGYICRNAYAEIDNLKRGGSDYTASLIGAALDAEEIQIWTDIDGLHNNDPRVVEHTQPVRHLHFDEAAELAYFGSKILHPTCIHPAKMQNIPVRLKYTMEPDAPGSFISNTIEQGTIKAVAVKDDITAIRVLSSRMLLATGFLRRVFEIFERHQTTIDMVTTSEVAVSLAIDDTSRLEEIVSELKKYGTVYLDHQMSIICIAGDLNWKNTGFEAHILDALTDVPVRMISYGGSNHNVSVVVRTEDKREALEALSNHLFNADGAVDLAEVASETHDPSPRA